jgi:hypothetical protein
MPDRATRRERSAAGGRQFVDAVPEGLFGLGRRFGGGRALVSGRIRTRVVRLLDLVPAIALLLRRKVVLRLLDVISIVHAPRFRVSPAPRKGVADLTGA